jgi:hypothetical protein
MLPLGLEDAIKVINRRRGRIKINCVFCERRVGWMDISGMELMIKRFGVSVCADCEPQLNSWIRSGEIYEAGKYTR